MSHVRDILFICLKHINQKERKEKQRTGFSCGKEQQRAEMFYLEEGEKEEKNSQFRKITSVTSIFFLTQHIIFPRENYVLGAQIL